MGQLSILIVDDDDVVRYTLARVFVDHDVCEVSSVDRALAVLAEGRPVDVILSDVSMPFRTGIDFYRELERTWPLLASRFVFITGGPATEDAARFLEQSGRPVVLKPYNRAELRRAVEQAAVHQDWAVLAGLSARHIHARR